MSHKDASQVVFHPTLSMTYGQIVPRMHVVQCDDSSGLVVGIQDANGCCVTCVYDNANRLVGTVNPLGHRTTFVYDIEGKIAAIQDAHADLASSVHDRSHFATIDESGNPRVFVLTPRELQVLRMLPATDSYGEIAINLEISEKTVQRHMESLFEKTGLHRRHLLIEWGRRQGIK